MSSNLTRHRRRRITWVDVRFYGALTVALAAFGAGAGWFAAPYVVPT